MKNKKTDTSPSVAENFVKTEKKIPLEVDSVTNSAMRHEKTTHSASGVKTEADNKTGKAVFSLPLSVWSQQLRGKCLISCEFLSLQDLLRVGGFNLPENCALRLLILNYGCML